MPDASDGRRQPLLTEGCLFVVIERYELPAGRPAQEEVGEGRVAGEHGAVEIGAEHLPARPSLASPAVADAPGDGRERLGTGPTGDACMVLEGRSTSAETGNPPR